MKKVLLIAAVAGMAMVSCKKDYTCECTTKDNGTVMGTSSVTIKDTKKNADEACSGKASTTGGGTTISTECAIK